LPENIMNTYLQWLQYVQEKRNWYKNFDTRVSRKEVKWECMLCFLTTHCSLRLIVRAELEVKLSPPGVSTRVTTREHPAAEDGTVGEKCPVILPKCRLALHLGILYMP
jgi:hypothetical protein